MAYPIQCAAGFPMPLIAGKYEVLGFCAAIETTANTSEIAIFDDEKISKDDKFGRLIPLSDLPKTKTLLVNIKCVASLDKTVMFDFPEPIKVRYGISIAADNIVGGTICVYRR